MIKNLLRIFTFIYLFVINTSFIVPKIGIKQLKILPTKCNIKSNDYTDFEPNLYLESLNNRTMNSNNNSIQKKKNY